jgi:hypothetical protein
MSATQGTNGELYLTRVLRRGLRHDRCLGRQFPLRPSPYDVIKTPDPPRRVSASPEGHVEPSGKTWSHGGPPTTALAPIDGMDMTVHSQQEHRNHTLTRHDPGHSTTMTSIPPQQRG